MIALMLLFVLCVAVCGGVGLAAYRNGWTMPGGGPAAWGRTAAARYGAGPAALVIFVGGSLATWLLTLPVGFLAKALEGPLDHPAFRFTQSRVHGTNKFTALDEKLTVMGNNSEIQLICLFALVALACAYGRRWWVPVVLTVAMFYVERYAQRTLAKVVDRGHPPTAGGTFPSGGVARLLCVYGLLIVLALMLAPQISHAFRVGIYTGLGAAAVIEAYTRWYLAKHWITDALSGLVFGYLLLVVGTAAAAALTYSYGPTRRGAAPPPQPGGHRAGSGPRSTHVEEVGAARYSVGSSADVVPPPPGHPSPERAYASRRSAATVATPKAK